MIRDRYTHPEKYKKSNVHNRFITLLYICKQHFTNGNSVHNSVSDRAFFDEFVEMLKVKK